MLKGGLDKGMFWTVFRFLAVELFLANIAKNEDRSPDMEITASFAFGAPSFSFFLSVRFCFINVAFRRAEGQIWRIFVYKR